MIRMEERSEEQVISRLFDLENGGLAAQRAELTGERFLSLIQDPDNGLGYVFQHGLDETEGAEVPLGTEYWEYATLAEAERAYSQLLDEDRRAGEVVETDTDEGLGDSETGGAEVRDRYSASDEDSRSEEEVRQSICEAREPRVSIGSQQLEHQPDHQQRVDDPEHEVDDVHRAPRGSRALDNGSFPNRRRSGVVDDGRLFTDCA